MMERSRLPMRGEGPLRLFGRDDPCIVCDTSSQLVCPPCGDGQTCTFTVQSCHSCPKAMCRDVASSAPGNNDGGGGGDHKGPSAGPIAGGVIGGIIAIAAITYLVWRFLIKPKRGRIPDESIYEADSTPVGYVEKNNNAGLGRRASTYTVHSIASTVLTRASNIIQIAYIPGVTNRATPTSPSVLVPPVPPIPSHLAREGEEARDDQHYFVPSDLRDSTYSGYSGYTDRTSYAPRASIASTIYGKQALVQTASQAGMRAKPTVVSVKSGNSSTPSTPPVPSIDFEKFGNGPERPQSTVSTFSVGSTFVNNANTATQGRAQVVKLGSGLKKIEIAPKSDASSSAPSSSDSSTQSAKDAPSSDTGSIPIITETPADNQGPFADPPSQVTTPSSTGSAALGPIGENEPEATHSHLPARGSSPFGDEHATK